ncbi:MAG: CoA-acylating methylmalonate-semialdehyde dehydrogenase [Steroidobacteraceae bacterium]
MALDVREIPHFIDGVAVPGASGRFAEVFDPARGTPQARVPLGGEAEVACAVAAAAAAQPAWASLNPQRRARVLFEFKRLLESRIEELAALLSSEHGKLLAESRGDIERGLDVIEFACGIPHLLKGEYSRGAGPGIDVYSLREPLGVVAGITPFNFPAMIPMWMLGPAIACGNAFVLKPSEKDPSVPVRLAQLMLEAGAPAGILNVVHGDRGAVSALVAHPLVAAVSFVGSSAAAQQVYAAASALGKRVQAMGGAKNHGIVLPDADLDRAVHDIIGAAFGSAGERCMALPVIVAVGEPTAETLRSKLIAALGRLEPGAPDDPSAAYGPLVTAEHRERVLRYIELALQEGAELVLDGRNASAGHACSGGGEGFTLGPTLLDHVTPAMRSYQEEIFGPVLQLVRARTFEEALALASAHPYGNGASIFTRSGRAAREFAARVSAGMVGINVPIPVPVAYHSFGGWKRSAFGDANQHGMEGVRFFTRVKTVTARWPDDEVPSVAQ